MDSRKVEILNAIINSYISSPSPVGSRTISKDFNLGVSSATIRNEMADLEDLGYLNKPHTSAGRIPSAKAYRFFVDELQKHFLNDEIIRDNLMEIMLTGADSINDVFRNAAKILAEKSNYISYVISFKKPDARIKLVQLVLIDPLTVLLLVVGDKGVVEKHFFKLDVQITEGELENINSLLSDNLVGINLIELDRLDISISSSMAQWANFITDVVRTISDFNKEVEKIDFFYDGIKNVFNFQDEIDKSQVIDIMNLMESSYLADKLNEVDEDLTVIIGNENEIDIIKENSIIVSSFHDKNRELIGKVGILGPIRMDYRSQIQNVKIIRDNLKLAIDNMLR
ncbi:heat-inducible transcriptional repressor HrcA [Peptoniphilus asaccharolyticus]